MCCPNLDAKLHVWKLFLFADVIEGDKIQENEVTGKCDARGRN